MDAAAMQARAAEATAFLKSFAHRDRLLIACALVEGERSVGELEAMLGIRQPGLSQQLAGLRAAGLVATRRSGKAVFYRLADGRVAAFIRTLHDLFCAEETPHG
ncbi:ArsR/SmtB family transcription factor [Teichococcus cervicalis]|uniref:Biofilm growth-associated repressor n=1 Tax=Pseudoroseomonas cervicalis ATCC 49957 TaxID=525371 RepID=D5RJH4_9PROT|nr:metalloregulator ArsR/SmtB family transcription factor [Pseudoroseomonas cervicalis]EFH12540.1 biofilm growth-associated repressor [Pseudoroseomonas cervicalis ATCC 49957]